MALRIHRQLRFIEFRWTSGRGISSRHWRDLIAAWLWVKVHGSGADMKTVVV